MAQYAGAIDQGTTSTRFMIFDKGGNVVSIAQKEHEQIYPKPGWVEHDPAEVWARTSEVVAEAIASAGIDKGELSGIGITNQRETTVVWDRNTGEAVHNAIVWQDTRTDQICNKLSADGGQDRFRAKTGLPIATYFSGPKVRWILDNVDGAEKRAEAGDLLFGNMDTWVIWNLTGGPDGGLHITDVSNASRTMLMDLATQDWDQELLDTIGVPRAMLPEIKGSSQVYGEATLDAVAGIPVAGDLGDQQAALFGQTCFAVGEAKNTYGTGNFLLLNTGTEAGAVEERPHHHRRLQDRRPADGLRARGGDRDHRGARAVAARQPQADQGRARGRGPGQDGRRQRRLLLRPGVLGALRSLLAQRRPRCDRGPDAVRELRPHRARDPRGDGLPDPRGLRGDGRRLGREARVAQGGRRHGRQRARSCSSRPTCWGSTSSGRRSPRPPPSAPPTRPGWPPGCWPEQEDLRENWVEDKRWSAKMDSAQADKYYREWKKAVTKSFDWVEEG